ITSNKRRAGRSGCGLQVAQRIDGIPVDPDLEMQVWAEAVPRTADVADHLALADLRPGRDRIRRLMGIAGRHAAAVVDAGVVAVATDPAGEHDGAGRGRVDRRSVRDADVDTRVKPAAGV